MITLPPTHEGAPLYDRRPDADVLAKRIERDQPTRLVVVAVANFSLSTGKTYYEAVVAAVLPCGKRVKYYTNARRDRIQALRWDVEPVLIDLPQWRSAGTAVYQAAWKEARGT